MLIILNTGKSLILCVAIGLFHMPHVHVSLTWPMTSNILQHSLQLIKIVIVKPIIVLLKTDQRFLYKVVNTSFKITLFPYSLKNNASVSKHH